MSTIVTRVGKGSPLTHAEIDANFENLNADKYQAGDDPTFGTSTNTQVKTVSFELDGTLITATAAEINHLSGVTSGVQAQLDAKVPLSRSAGSQHFGLLELPSIFSDIPVAIEQDFYGKYISGSFDETSAAAESASKVTYYVKLGAAPGGAGLSELDPFDSMLDVITLLGTTPPTTDIEIIIIGGGVFNRSRAAYGYGTFWDYPHNLSIVSDSPAWLTAGDYGTAFSWTPDGAAYSTSRPATLEVFDFSKKDYRELPQRLEKVASVAECQALAGSWYTDGSTVWVRLFDDRAPDKDLLVSISMNPPEFKLSSGKEIFLKNINFAGGNGTFGALRVNTTVGDSGVLKAIKCAFIGATDSNGLDADRVQTYLRDCTASFNGRDGFNYHDNISSPQAVAVEVGCHAYKNGTEGNNTCNGSTAHDGMRVVRFGSVCFSNIGPNFADVNGSYSFNVNCFGANSLRTDSPAKANFFFDDNSAVTPGESWLIGCGGADSLYDIGSDGSAEINVRGWMGVPAIDSGTTINTI